MITAKIDLDFGVLDSLKGTATDKGITAAARKAINRAAKPARQEMISLTDRLKLYGHLSRSIGTKVKLYPKSQTFTVHIGAKRSYKRKGKKRTRGRFKGTRPDIRPSTYAMHRLRGTRRSRGDDYVTPVHDKWSGYMAKTVVKEIQREIEIAAAKKRLKRNR